MVCLADVAERIGDYPDIAEVVGQPPLVDGGRAGHIDMAGVRQYTVWHAIATDDIPGIPEPPANFRGIVYYCQ